jgi:predicted nucleic acid-binding protein
LLGSFVEIWGWFIIERVNDNLPRIYIDTTVISYITSRTSRDFILASKQLAAQMWWGRQSLQFHPFISSLVIEECSKGNPSAAAMRLATCDGVERVVVGAAELSLADRLMTLGAVPITEPEDATHIATACLHGAKYIATLNFAHMVNPEAKFKLQVALAKLGYNPPYIASPNELLEATL